MNFPSTFIDEIQSRVSLSRIAGKLVAWDKRKSKPAKGEYWACCPFHHEKTPSFRVSDHKGLYYCFGCQAKGGLISFVQKTRNMDFREAVEFLAAEAGLELPARSPSYEKERSEEELLFKINESAAEFFRLQLGTSAGMDAREYLTARGISNATIKSFSLGFAPSGGNPLLGELRKRGYSDDQIIKAGLAGGEADENSIYDRFRNRIMFPIKDYRDRVIAFGGRAMEPDVPAKYLNSPETPIFRKGSLLYNFPSARNAFAKAGVMIMAEGYMDVIALFEAGFPSAVAPMGTAVTEQQLKSMWRVAEEPVVAMDGDAAGRKAAMRMIDIALPLLEPGKSLRFCNLPPGSDPDDYVRAYGAQAFAELLQSADPMVELLWRREVSSGSFDTPEQRAALEASLERAASTIKDGKVLKRYREYLRERVFRHFRGERISRSSSGAFSKPSARPKEETLRSALARNGVQNGGNLNADKCLEAAVLAICLQHPGIISKFEVRLESLELSDSGYSEVLSAILHLNALDDSWEHRDFRSKVEAEVGSERVERLFAAAGMKNIPAIKNPKAPDPDTALEEEIRKIEAKNAALALYTDFREKYETIHPDYDTAATWSGGLKEAAQDRRNAQRGIDPLETGDFVKGENRIPISHADHEELNEWLKGSGGLKEAAQDRRSARHGIDPLETGDFVKGENRILISRADHDEMDKWVKG